MKHSLASKIIILLVPLLLLDFICPKTVRNSVFDFAAGQVVTVYSFVMVPLLEASMLVVQHIILPKAIAEQAKNSDASGKKPASSNDNADYIIPSTLAGMFTAAVRKFILSSAGLLTLLCAVASGLNYLNLLQITQFFVVLPFVKQSILRSNPSLARGDPPALLPQ